MAKTFNNINKTDFPQEAALNLSGWERTAAYDQDRIPRITDTVGAGIALAKMGTSIPTPFARIFLFKTAFEMVNASAEGANDNSAYGKLVSECLDFIEFIYNYGDRISVQAWNVRSNIQALKNSPSEGHQRLGTSLEHFALNLDVADIYLIYYDNVLIGGTSPFTLVYTSPNWQRVKNITNARGMANNQLFPDYSDPTVDAVPLHRRHSEFQIMLTRYYCAYSMLPGLGNSAFFSYIYRNQDLFNTDLKAEFALMMKDGYSAARLANDYECVQDNRGHVDILGKGGHAIIILPRKKRVTPPPVNNDYKIDTNSQRYSGSTPLVLTERGITSALYVGNQPMPRDIIIERNPDQDMNERILPGGQNIKYPFLTDADLLQEKLIKVPYDLDSNNFYTFGIDPENGNGSYLLPLTKTFFEYFSPEDFEKSNNLNIKLVQVDSESVEVQLIVPVQCETQPYIELVRQYNKKDIEVLSGDPELFTMAVYPSYKVIGGNIPNIYSILTHDVNKKSVRTFYALNSDSVSQVPVSNEKERNVNGSIYSELNTAFDFCEIQWNEAKAILIPRFKSITPADGGGNTVIGIDFGTTNSYVCYSTDQGADPKSLEITRADLQVLTLNKIDLSEGNFGDKYMDSMYMMPTFNQALDREFVPLLLGSQSDVAYPYRTVTCELNGFETKADAQLFADISVGFNFMKEFTDLPNEKYNSNIKWDIEIKNQTEPLVVKQNRVKAYCYQTAWMLKSKLMLLNAPRTQFSVFLTFPFTMSRPTKNEIERYWREAFEKYMGTGNVTINRVTESIAPYYSMISNDGNFTHNALNIDIGGGTTDMLFADVENSRFYYTSSMFAGNDIWGDGKHLVNKTRKDNGFVKDFESKLESNTLIVSDKRKEGYNSIKNIVSNSADLMSYVFRYDDEFNYISYIRQSKDKLLPVLCVHLAAILYHVAQVIRAKGMTIPSTITFSGMGSQYIRIITDNDEDVKELVKALLSSFLGYGIEDDDDQMPNDFTVTFQKKAKEVTAQGAMLVNHNSLDDIKNFKQKSLYVYGIDTNDDDIEYGNAPQYKNAVLEEFKKFVQAFVRNTKIRRYFRNNFEIDLTDNLAEVLENAASQSYDLMGREKAPNEIVEETLFFWPLKNGLYEASKL